MTWKAFALRAAERVLQNKGARTPGIDGKTKEDYRTAEERRQWSSEIVNALRGHRYHPSPVRRVYIDKPNKPGEKRPLGIATLTDRCVQEMLRSVLEPVFEGDFHPHSYGFRPYRSAHHALQRVRSLIKSGYNWIIEGDIKGFFDNVNHDTLLRLVQKKVGDRRILRLIRSFLKAGVLENDTFAISELGTPQGGIISPLLANIYLNELDQFVADKYENLTPQQRRKQPYGCFICRYADDFVVLVRGIQEDAESLKEELTIFLRDELGLHLSAEKTLITEANKGIDFLGFHIRRYYRGGIGKVLIMPSKKAKSKFRQRVSAITRDISKRDGWTWIVDLNLFLAGWAEYYRRASSKKTFSTLDYTVWWIIALRMRGRHHRLKKKGSFRTFMHQNLIPYAYDIEHPRNRHRKGRNFGHWIDETKKGALILDSLAFYPIQYARLFPQHSPYTIEGKRDLDELRRKGHLVAEAQRDEAEEGGATRRVFSILQRWLKHQENRCVNCRKDFDRRDLQAITQHFAQHLRPSDKTRTPILCKTCLQLH